MDPRFSSTAMITCTPKPGEPARAVARQRISTFALSKVKAEDSESLGDEFMIRCRVRKLARSSEALINTAPRARGHDLSGELSGF